MLIVVLVLIFMAILSFLGFCLLGYLSSIFEESDDEELDI